MHIPESKGCSQSLGQLWAPYSVGPGSGSLLTTLTAVLTHWSVGLLRRLSHITCLPSKSCYVATDIWFQRIPRGLTRGRLQTLDFSFCHPTLALVSLVSPLLWEHWDQAQDSADWSLPVCPVFRRASFCTWWTWGWLWLERVLKTSQLFSTGTFKTYWTTVCFSSSPCG